MNPRKIPTEYELEAYANRYPNRSWAPCSFCKRPTVPRYDELVLIDEAGRENYFCCEQHKIWWLVDQRK